MYDENNLNCTMDLQLEHERDAALAERYLAGEEEAFGELYDKYTRKIYGYVYCRLRHRENTEDVVSAVFLKAVEKMDSFDARRGVFSAWIYRIARNTMIDFLRTHKSTDDLDEAFVVRESDLEDRVDEGIKLEEVQKAMRVLPEREREILVLRVWQDLSYKEIAEVLGKSEASLKMNFSRSLKKLKGLVSTSVFIWFLIQMYE